MKTLTSIGPINSIARSEETHPLTWRLRDDAQPVWLEEYQQKNGYAAARKALTEMAQADIVQTVKESGEHAIPALDEGVTTVKQVNKSLEDVNKISAAASTTANNVGALTDLYGSFLGKPIIKIASTFYALKTTGQSFLAKNAAKTTVNDTAEKGE